MFSDREVWISYDSCKHYDSDTQNIAVAHRDPRAVLVVSASAAVGDRRVSVHRDGTDARAMPQLAQQISVRTRNDVGFLSDDCVFDFGVCAAAGLCAAVTCKFSWDSSGRVYPGHFPVLTGRFDFREVTC